MEKELFIAFSPHRVETLPFALKFMKKCDVIALEEPPNPVFEKVLKREAPIETYIEEGNFWFPEFSKRLMKELQRLYEEGKRVYQVEPYYQEVRKIQGALEEGVAPESLKEDPLTAMVYQTESKAFEKLLKYYELTFSSNFDEILDAVMEFAKADAERFLLRDRLRAVAIVNLLSQGKRFYIETGTIHIYFKKLLEVRLKGTCAIKHGFLLEEVVKRFAKKPWIFPPGETLTLRYIFKRKPNLREEKLLAARSLIYIKVIPKQELIPSDNDPYPHLSREVDAIKKVNLLDLKDCAELYYRMLPIKNYEDAKKVLDEYLSHKGIKVT